VRSRALAASHSPLRAGGVVWRFSRPHTIVGTTLSVVGLYLIAVAEGAPAGEVLHYEAPFGVGYMVAQLARTARAG
jgi:hypothetical protein